MTSRRKMIAALPVGALVFAGPVASAAPNSKAGQSMQAFVSGPASGTATGTFVGTLNVTGFSNNNGVITATAHLVGSVLDAAGSVIQSVDQTVTAPLASAAGSCQILNLVLGPLHLDLLGLVIDLNQVVLTITAVPGAGNLLGNLLCSLANLLNGGGPLQNLLQQLTGFLNQLLGML